MNKAEKLAEIAKKREEKAKKREENGSIFDHFIYHLMLINFKNLAKGGYTGTNWYFSLSSWLLNKLKQDGFYVIENFQDDDGDECTSIEWIPEDLSKN